MNVTKDDYDSLLLVIKKEFPDFKILKKSDSKLMKVIDMFLKVVTLGKMRSFMTNYTTTLGNTIYTSSEWDNRSVTTQISTLRHERVHMRQAKKHGKFLYSLMYILLPFPVGFALCRARFEMEAYEETLRTMYRFYGPAVLTKATKETILGYFMGPDYFWMWPWKKSLEIWYDDFVEKLKKFP